MKKLWKKSYIFLLLQIIFMLLTFVGVILFFTNVLDNAGMSVCCMVMSLAFGILFNQARKK